VTRSNGGAIRYQPTRASATAWRRFIDTELSERCELDKWDSTGGYCLSSPRVSLAIDDKIQMRLAQFNLANVPAGGITFFGYQPRPFETASGPAWREVAGIDRCERQSARD
jgi:hypothetical protein